MKATIVVEEPTAVLRVVVSRYTGKRTLQQLWKITDADKKNGTFTKTEWRNVPEVRE